MSSNMQSVDMPSINFDAISIAVGQSPLFNGASYAHGWICAMICAGRKLNGSSWMALLLDLNSRQDDTEIRNRQLLLDLYHQSSQQLHHLSFDFEMLLPADETTLGTRAEALTNWCEGFLEGLHLAGVKLEADDFAEIAKLDHSKIEACETDEAAFAHLVEHIRMSVLLIYIIMTAKQNRNKFAGTVTEGGNWVH